MYFCIYNKDINTTLALKRSSLGYNIPYYPQNTITSSDSTVVTYVLRRYVVS